MKTIAAALAIFILCAGLGAAPRASADSLMTCTSAEHSLCVDLVGAEITEKAVGPLTFIKVCGRHAAACAQLNLTTKECTIYHKAGWDNRMNQTTRIHETNHCHGWTHSHDTAKAYSHDWTVIHPSLSH